MKRLFDILFSLVVLTLGMPFFILISIIILSDAKGGVFFIQERIGKDKKPFKLFKFRTMKPFSEDSILLTVGAKDKRITKFGYLLRKYKLDEFPQLVNVIMGEMSIVGPRPEVKKYVELYNENQLKVLQVVPGLTDYASITYFEENKLLGQSINPEETYINEIMPIKLALNLKYIQEKSLKTDIKIIWKTFIRIFS